MIIKNETFFKSHLKKVFNKDIVTISNPCEADNIQYKKVIEI